MQMQIRLFQLKTKHSTDCVMRRRGSITATALSQSITVVALAYIALSPTLIAQAATPLDSRLDQLYNSVKTKFSKNPWFKNSADQDLSKSSSLPEFQMMNRELFRNSLKGYCTLLESPQAKLIKNPEHYGIVNFAQDASERRFFIYDVAKQEITHNLWTTHGSNSRISVQYTLKDTGAPELQRYTKSPVLQHEDSSHATLFSNRNGSLQSSVGMAIADTQTYFSTENEWTALRLSGVDGELNSHIRARAVVLHEYGYDSESMDEYEEPPLSEGCPMLPRKGFYQGRDEVEIAQLIMRELYGAPIFFYHDRMQSSVNESSYQAQLNLLKKLGAEISSQMTELSDEFGWEPAVRKKYESAVGEKLQSSLAPLIEETYQYFKNPSNYYGVEPKNPSSCLKALGI